MIRITTESPSSLRCCHDQTESPFSLRYCHDQTESTQNRHPASNIVMIRITTESPSSLRYCHGQNRHTASNIVMIRITTESPSSLKQLCKVNIHHPAPITAGCSVSCVDLHQSQLVVLSRVLTYTNHSWLFCLVC